MSKTHQAKLISLATLFLVPFCCMVPISSAQEVQAAMSNSTTLIGQPVELTLTAKGAKEVVVPEMLDIPGLLTKLNGRSTKFEMKDYKIQSSRIFTYEVTPERGGDFEIPPLKVNLDGRVFKTNPLKLSVKDAFVSSPQPNAGGDGELVYVEETKTKAASGDPGAQFTLGECFFTGRGVAKNEVEAVKWFRKSAEQGNTDAQAKLGWCYLNGVGIPKDDAEAVRWLRGAADKGNSDAKHNLGKCYLNGAGVPKDHIEAYALFNISGVQDESARASRDEVAESMSAEQISAAQKRSKELMSDFEAKSSAD
jgi:TPR repeat protein